MAAQVAGYYSNVPSRKKDSYNTLLEETLAVVEKCLVWKARLSRSLCLICNSILLSFGKNTCSSGGVVPILILRNKPSITMSLRLLKRASLKLLTASNSDNFMSRWKYNGTRPTQTSVDAAA